MNAWFAWFGSLGDGLIDGGKPIGSASTINSDGSVVSGGGSNPVSGYSVIEAAGMDAAITLAKDCPVLTAVAGCAATRVPIVRCRRPVPARNGRSGVASHVVTQAQRNVPERPAPIGRYGRGQRDHSSPTSSSHAGLRPSLGCHRPG